MNWFIAITVAVFAIVPAWYLHQRPERLIYALVLFLPFEEFVEKWLPQGVVVLVARSLAEALLLTGLSFVLLRKILTNAGWKRTPIGLPLFAFIVVAVISSAVNGVHWWVTGLGLRPLLRYVTVFYIAANLNDSAILTRRTMRLLFSAATVVCGIALLQSIVGGPMDAFLRPETVEVSGTVVKAAIRGQVGEHTRVFATLGRYDTLGTFLTLVLLISAGIYAGAKEADRKRIRLLWIVGVPAVILSYSRQSWLALWLGTTVIVWLNRRRWLAMGVFLAPVLVGVIMAIVIPAAVAYSSNRGDVTLVNRMLEPFSAQYWDTSLNWYGRLYVIVKVGSRILSRATWLGFGPGAFGSLTARLLGFDFGARVGVPLASAFMINDVNWITLLGQVGIAGLGAFVGILAAMGNAARKALRVPGSGYLRGFARGYVGVLLAFVLFGFFGPNFEVRQVAFYFWLISGLLVSLVSGELREEQHAVTSPATAMSP